MPLPTIFAPTIAVEKSLQTYLSSSLNGGVSGSATPIYVYRGIDNGDKQSPAVIIWCKDASEVAFNTRCYAFDTEIMVKQTAADATVEEYNTLAGNVFSRFSDSIKNSIDITSGSVGLSVWQVQILNFADAHTEDAWSANLTVRMIGALTP